MKLCPYPFSRLQTNHHDGNILSESEGFFPCCHSWFTKEYYNLPKENNLEEIWNGRAATELRKRMYEGDYSLCDRSTCKMPLLTVEELSDKTINYVETPISKENLEAIQRKDPIMPNPPASIHLSADLTCNLSCKSCRPRIMPNSKPSIHAQGEAEYVMKLREHIQIIKMSSGGEVFYSTLQRQLLKSYNPQDFPKLERVHIVTNGTLFNQKTYKDLLPGSQYIKDVSVSLDAGSKEVYELIRGPYWDQVYENLQWMSQMRRDGKFDFFSINFILQKGNYKDIPNFVKLGKFLGVDRMLIQRYLPYDGQGFMEEERIEQSVHLPEHPNYCEVMSILENYRNEPNLYTFLELEGYEEKISKAVDVRKAQRHYLDGEEKFKLGDLKGALQDIEESIKLRPVDFAIQLRTEICACLAIDCVSKDIDLAHHYLGLAYPGLKVDENEQRIKITNRFERAGFDYQEKNEYALAIKVFNLVSEFDKLSANALFSQAISYKGLGQQKEYEDCLDASLQTEAPNYYALLEKAFLLIAKNDLAKSITFFEQANAVEPADKKGESYRRLYFLLIEHSWALALKNNYFESLKFINTACEFSLPEKKEAFEKKYYILIKQGFWEIDQGNNEKALLIFNEAQLIEPLSKRGDTEGYIRELNFQTAREGCFSAQRSGRYQNALEFFREASKWGTPDPELIFAYGISLKRTKEFSLAEEHFRKSIAGSPKHYWAWLELGYLEIRKNRRDKALEIFLKAREFEPASNKGNTEKYIKLCQRKSKFKIISHA